MIKTLVLIGGFQAATIAVTVVRSKVISITLGPSGLGVIGTIDQLLTVVLQLSSLSLPAVALRLLPRSHGVAPEAFRRQYANFVQAVVGATTIGTALIAAVLWTSPGLLGDELASYRGEVAIGLASVPLLALGLLLPNVLAAAQEQAGAALVYFAVAAVAALAAGAGVVTGGIRDIYLFQLALLGICICATLVYLHRRCDLPLAAGGGVTHLIRDHPDLVETAAVAYVIFLGTALALFVVRSVTLSARGADTAGLLQGLLSTGLAVGAVLSAMAGRYLGPLLNRRIEPVDKRAVAELFRRRQLMLLALIALPLVLFADLALTLLFSSRFTAAAQWLPAFLVWQLVTLQVGIQQQLLFALDDLRPVAVIAAAGTALSVAGSALLIPRFGLTGAAAAMLAGALLMNAMGAYRLRRRHQIAPQAASRLLTTYIVMILLVTPYGLALVDAGPAAALAVRVATIAAVIGSLWLFLTGDERTEIRQRIRRYVPA